MVHESSRTVATPWPSALLRRMSTTWLLLVTSLRDHTSAAAPATCGVAIDVPVSPRVAPCVAGSRRAAARGQRVGGHDDVARSRDVDPASVVGERRPLVVLVERGDGDDVVEGGRVEGAVVPSLPAPATMTSPAFQASCTASSSDCEYAVSPRLMLMTLAPSVMARAIAC